MPSDFDNLSSVVVNGASLAYRERGRGEPVVLVHGGASDLRTWHSQLDALGAYYHAIAYSRRYARPNADIAAGLDDPMDAHVDDLVSLLGRLGLDRVHLVGQSYGAFVALLAAIRKRPIARSLILMEPPVLTLLVSPQPRPMELIRLFMHSPRTAAAIMTFGARAVSPAQRAFRSGDDKAAIRAFGTGVLGRAYFDKLSETRMQQVWQNRRAEKAQLLGQGFPPLDKADLRALDVPTMLLVGQRSPPFLRHLSAHLHALLPQSQLKEIADASHLMHEDNARDVNAAILTFLAGRSG
ncbi:MAG: alpha/beta hydrolase [Hyphomicrobiaceae bacterium]